MIKELAEIQQKLKAPKSQFNSFGKYHYRNQEDILEAVKPLLGELVLTISDEIVEVGGRVYVKAVASITDGKNTIENKAFAREPNAKKGMDESQITGAASSYARKYALNGLFLIDDTKDADSSEQVIQSKASQFKLDDVAGQWIQAIKSGNSKLEDIEDPAYRKFIEGNL